MRRESRRIGVLGLGAIGRPVARALAKGTPGLALAGVTSRDAGRAREFLADLPGHPPFLEFPELVERSDVIVEAATRAALVELAPAILDAGRDLVILSIGALLDHPEASRQARRAHPRALGRHRGPRRVEGGRRER
jgi:aspartate dehydrogenase